MKLNHDYSQEWKHPINHRKMTENVTVAFKDEEATVRELQHQWGIDVQNMLGRAGKKELTCTIQRKTLNAVKNYAKKKGYVDDCKMQISAKTPEDIRTLFKTIAADWLEPSAYCSVGLCQLLTNQKISLPAKTSYDEYYYISHTIFLHEGNWRNNGIYRFVTNINVYCVVPQFFNDMQVLLFDEKNPRHCRIINFNFNKDKQSIHRV